MDFLKGLNAQQQEAVAVNYPASSAYATGMGGTAIDSTKQAYMTARQGYWSAQGSSGGLLMRIRTLTMAGLKPKSGNAAALSDSGADEMTCRIRLRTNPTSVTMNQVHMRVG